MSQQVTISDIAARVRAGELLEAKRQARALLDTAEPRHLEVIAQCAAIAETYPRTAVTRLRWMWHQADADARAIIEACAPAPGEDRSRPQPETQLPPRWNGRTRYQAPSTVTVRQGRPRRPQRRSVEPAVSVRYHETRAGVDDQPHHGERPDGYANDYDRAAVPAQRGTGCLSCWVERAAADLRRPDDGLCSECRDAGRRGIAPLPAGHSHADAIAARCGFIAAHHLPATARHLLRADWQHSQPRDRETIAAWVAAHPITDTPTATDTADEPGARLTKCATCAEPRTPRDLRHQAADDGQCADCRAFAPADTDDVTSPAIDASEPRELAAVA
jgi:hypothetical protein